MTWLLGFEYVMLVDCWRCFITCWCIPLRSFVL